MERIQLPPLDDPSAPQQRDHFLGELLVLRVALSQCSGHSSIWRTWRPAVSTFSAIRVARFMHPRALHRET
jgi:hypothetical protein